MANAGNNKFFVLKYCMVRRSVYDAYDALEEPKKSFQAFLVDQLDLCVEVLSDVCRTAVKDDNGNCIVLAVERPRHANDPGPSYSLFYEDIEIGRLANLDYLLSVMLGAKLNAAQTGICVECDTEAFKALVTEKLNAMHGCVRPQSAAGFAVRWL